VKRDRVVVAGGMAHNPYGGHAWVFLQYLLGFRRLGYDVLFVDRRNADMAISDEAGFDRDREVLEPFGLAEHLALLTQSGDQTLGVEFHEVLDYVQQSALFLNFMGFITDERILGAARCRVFFDLDPGFDQMWRELGLVDVLSGHDRYVTIAQNIGQPDCAVPTCGFDWIPTSHPIVLGEWPAVRRDGPFTTVGAWRGPNAPVNYLGKTYGLRAHEFRRFASLPKRSTANFAAALDIDPGDGNDIELLRQNGWTLVDAAAATGTPSAYRSFIQRSGAEFAPAKNMFVQARAGWFSDRSICYLASGKPVLVQDTGLGSHYPHGEGLLTFDTIDDAVEGVDSIMNDYDRHARAARSIAVDVFDSDKVLKELMEKLAA